MWLRSQVRDKVRHLGDRCWITLELLQKFSLSPTLVWSYYLSSSADKTIAIFSANLFVL
ncbi:hypothetical protein P5673_013854 [Acropora cervicornis]|uniref:Uncharacterized protein n=1 Tax=Acropora cervicornis TaxID=6130 RepID=A0AAD9QKI2_ACRCE|nr:hypothetical protein P5673_013854 [Acropora cervicornis]